MNKSKREQSEHAVRLMAYQLFKYHKTMVPLLWNHLSKTSWRMNILQMQSTRLNQNCNYATNLLHHVEIGAKNGIDTVKKLVTNFKFKVIAQKESTLVSQWVLAAGSIRFLVSQLKCEHNISELGDLSSENYISNWTEYLKNLHNNIDWNCVRKMPKYEVPVVDSVFNVALEVKDVEKCVARVIKFGGEVIREPVSVEDQYGSVTYATVRSCLGNVHHTLVNSQKYNGVFLPGFSEMILKENEIDLNNIHSSKNSNSGDLFCDSSKDLFKYIDHITFACSRGMSKHVLNWYANVFGMQRFKLNHLESKDDGFVIKGSNTGMKLFAMDYWKCAEEGIAFTDGENTENSVKFVMAEALDGQGPNQVESFIESHGGPGLQHIGLYTDNMVEAVKLCSQHGAEFLIPPPTYYTLVGKKKEIEMVGENLNELQEYGILLDAEADANDEHENNQYRYLMQVFSKPLFNRDTFFLEIIHRKGASGFGAGNISALWNSVAAFLNSNKSTSNQSLKQ